MHTVRGSILPVQHWKSHLVEQFFTCKISWKSSNIIEASMASLDSWLSKSWLTITLCNIKNAFGILDTLFWQFPKTVSNELKKRREQQEDVGLNYNNQRLLCTEWNITQNVKGSAWERMRGFFCSIHTGQETVGSFIVSRAVRALIQVKTPSF